MESASKIHGNPCLSPSKKRKVSLAGLINYAPTKKLTKMSKGSKKIHEKVVLSLANIAGTPR